MEFVCGVIFKVTNPVYKLNKIIMDYRNTKKNWISIGDNHIPKVFFKNKIFKDEN